MKMYADIYCLNEKILVLKHLLTLLKLNVVAVVVAAAEMMVIYLLLNYVVLAAD